VYLMNGWKNSNMLSNQEESGILNKNALFWLLAHSPKSRRGQLLLSHPIRSSSVTAQDVRTLLRSREC
jgi:hypothetical protein